MAIQIKVSNEMWRFLTNLKKPGESFESVLRRKFGLKPLLRRKGRK